MTDETAHYSEGGWPIAPDWLPKDRAQEYAAYLNTYSHNTNLLRYLFGRTPSVESVWFGHPAGQIAVLDFGGFVASLETGQSSNRGWDETTDIYFAHGRLSIRTPPALLRNTPAQIELYEGGNIQEVRSPKCGWSWAFRRQAEGFVKEVLYRRDPVSPGADALEDLRLIEELWRTEMRRRPSDDANATRRVRTGNAVEPLVGFA